MKRIVYFQPKQVTNVESALREHFDLSTEKIQFLFQFGALYVDKKRILQNQRIVPESVLRIHLQPKRFAIENINWSSQVVFSCKDYLVLNKPSGVPVGPSLDNFVENCWFQLERAFGTVHITTRLDVPTRGLLVFARNQKFLKSFNTMIMNGEVSKNYRGITSGEVQVGTHIHFMEKSPRSPRKIFAQAAQNRQRCELQVLRCTELEQDRWVSEILLVTGRTHQIRAQFAYLGVPIWNDSLYGAHKQKGFRGIGLECSKLGFHWGGESVEYELGSVESQ